MTRTVFQYAFLMCVLVSCAGTDIGEAESNQLLFSVSSVSDSKASCASGVGDRICFFAYLAPDGVPIGDTRPSFASNCLCIRREDGLYVPEKALPPIDFRVFGKARFCFYGPAGVSGVSTSGDDAEGLPFLYFSVPEDPAAQEDIYAGSSCEYDADSFLDPSTGSYCRLEVVSASLQHILTCVRVQTDDSGISSAVVKSVSFKGLYSKGTYSFASAEWSGHQLEGKCFRVPTDVCLDGTPHQPVISPEMGTSLMMLPQVLPSSAIIEVVLDTEDGEETCTFSIGGQIWKAGCHATYQLHADRPSGSFNINPFIPGGTQDEIL